MSLYRIVGGDVGTQIVFTVREWPIGTAPTPGALAPVVDLTSATNIQMILIPPDNLGLLPRTVSAALYAGGADGNIAYTTSSGDIPALPSDGPSQLWQVRAAFTLGGWSGHSEPDTFWVDP